MSMEEFLVFRQERMGRRPRKASALTLRRKLERTPLVEFRKRKKEQE